MHASASCYKISARVVARRSCRLMRLGPRDEGGVGKGGLFLPPSAGGRAQCVEPPSGARLRINLSRATFRKTLLPARGRPLVRASGRLPRSFFVVVVEIEAPVPLLLFVSQSAGWLLRAARGFNSSDNRGEGATTRRIGGGGGKKESCWWEEMSHNGAAPSQRGAIYLRSAIS